MRNLFIYALIVTTLSGCAGVLNPYNSEFSCPKTYKGKCVSIQKAYEESLDPNWKEPEDNDYKYELNKTQGKDFSGGCTGGNCQKSTGVLKLDELQSDGSTGVYQESLYRKLSGLLKEPVTPVVVPPKIMRVLILGYSDKDRELFMPRYVYFMADEPKWMLVDPYMQVNE